MAAPTLLDYAESNWTDSSATTDTTDDLDWNASGDIIVALGATEDNGVTMATPTGTGVTLAALSGLPTNTGSSCKVYGWSATASGNGNTVLTSTNGASGARGIAAWAYSGSGGLGTPVTNVGSGTTVSMTVAQDSSVVMVLADWNATADVTVTTDPVGGTIRQNNQVSGLATFLVIEWANQSAGTRNYGVSGWTGTGTISKAAVEVTGVGGTAFTRTVDDAAGLVDTRTLAQASSATDTAGLADTAAAAAGFARSQDDPGGLVDSAVAALAAARTATDVAGLIDAAAAALAAARTIDDPAGLTDAAAAALGAGRTTTDGAGLTDGVSTLLFTLFTRTVDDSTGVTDLGAPQALDVAETVNDPAGLTDIATPVLTAGGTSHTRTIDDSATPTDTVAAAAEHGRTVTDAAGSTDTAAAATAHARTVTDAGGLTDATSTQLAGAGTRTVDDAAGLTDAVTYSSTQTAGSVVGLTDTATAELAAARTITDFAGLADAVSQALAVATSVTDSAGLSDAASAQLSVGNAHVRTVTDSAGLRSQHRTQCTTHRRNTGRTSRPNAGTTYRYPLIPD